MATGSKKYWANFAELCDVFGFDFTAICIANSITNAEDLSISSGDDEDFVIEKILESEAFEDMISEIKKHAKGKSSFGKTFYMTFDYSDDIDLFGSLHNVSCWITGSKNSNGEKLTLNITIKDTFDFKYNAIEMFSKDKSFLSKLAM